MARRIELYRREPRPRRAPRGPLTAARAWRAFFALLLIWSGIAAVVWLAGYDFTAESGYRKAKMCGFARLVLPGGLGESVSCVWWNLAPFYLMPAVVLFIAVKKSLARA
jgi:hypothetical protein